MGKIGPSIPIFLATGNHEDEEGWNLDDTGNYATGLWNIDVRKTYFPTPTQDGFYSGNTDPLPTAIGGDTNREDYYAWAWGDALFVVIDEFQYTMASPTAPLAGETSDDPKTGDQWSWTLGQQQYDWLEQTLEDSDARYKFVFSHNMVGGIPRTSASTRRATSAAEQRPPATSSGAARTSTARRVRDAASAAGTRRSSSCSRRTASAPTSTATITGTSTRAPARSTAYVVYQEVPSAAP